MLSEGIGHKGGRRDLNHNADLQLLIESNLLRAQFSLVLFHKRVGLLQFAQAGNHRIHHFDVSMHAGAEDSAKLVPENSMFNETKTDGAPTQERIQLAWQL